MQLAARSIRARPRSTALRCVTMWSKHHTLARAEAAAALKASNALSMAKHEGRKAMEAAQAAQEKAAAEASEIRALLQSAQGDDATALLDRLRDVEAREAHARQSQSEAEQQSALRMLRAASTRWRLQGVARCVSAWKVGHAVAARQADKGLIVTHADGRGLGVADHAGC